jgi:hypothetical protein
MVIAARHRSPSLRTRRCARLSRATAVAMVAACGGDPAGPPPAVTTELAVVLSSVDRSVTVFPVDDPAAAFTFGIAPAGSPVSIAVRGGTAIVPLGTVPAAAILDLAERRVVATVALATGSGATGVAFVNDSIALVGNPGLGTVSPINVRRATRGADIPVGVYPGAITAVRDTAWVLNANLVGFVPAGPSSISVLTGAVPAVARTVALTGLNASAAVATADGRLLVLNAGRWGAADGSLSIVSRAAGTESQHIAGFGDFPGGIAMTPDGRALIASFAYGIAVWHAGTGSFVRPPHNAIAPGGIAASAGVGVDGDGRVYTLKPDCSEPSAVFRLNAAFAIEREVPTGICPIAIAFTRIPSR